VTFGGPASWDAILDFEYHCESANVQTDGTGGYVSSPATKRKWKAAPKIAGFRLSFVKASAVRTD
jgi:hypothetical protein